MNQQQVALITGAGSGIGREATIALLGAGFAVVLAGRQQSALEETVQLANEETAAATTTSSTLIVPTDVTKADQVQSLFDRVEERFGRLDVLFNNAGIGNPPINMEDISYDTWRSVLDTNVTGTFLCSQHAIRMMKRRTSRSDQDGCTDDDGNSPGGAVGTTGGRIINNGSISAHTPRPNSAPYTAAKHAITGLTKSINLDGRQYNICCSQIDIGNAATPMTSKMKDGVAQPNGQIIPEPTMPVEEIGKAVVYLATLPTGVNVPYITIMAHQMPFMGRG